MIMAHADLMTDVRQAFREWVSGEAPTPRSELKRNLLSPPSTPPLAKLSPGKDRLMTDLLNRILRTESIATIVGLVLFASGRVQTMEEAVALGAVIGPLVLGRSYVKARDGNRLR